jgi:transposase InsO family protein
LPVAANLLEQNFMADKPDQKWVSDIASVWTHESWLYLAVVLELYDVVTLNRTHSLKYLKEGVCKNESRKTESLYG